MSFMPRQALPTLDEAAGFSPAQVVELALDRATLERDVGQLQQKIAGLQASYSEETGVKSLKIKHNNVLGYFIEVTSAQAGRVPAGFVQRQDMVGASRYSTDELARHHARFLGYLDRLAERRDQLQRLARDTGWAFHTHRTDAPALPALLWLYTVIGGRA